MGLAAMRDRGALSRRASPASRHSSLRVISASGGRSVPPARSPLGRLSSSSSRCEWPRRSARRLRSPSHTSMLWLSPLSPGDMGEPTDRHLRQPAALARDGCSWLTPRRTMCAMTRLVDLLSRRGQMNDEQRVGSFEHAGTHRPDRSQAEVGPASEQVPSTCGTVDLERHHLVRHIDISPHRPLTVGRRRRSVRYRP